MQPHSPLNWDVFENKGRAIVSHVKIIGRILYLIPLNTIPVKTSWCKTSVHGSRKAYPGGFIHPYHKANKMTFDRRILYPASQRIAMKGQNPYWLFLKNLAPSMFNWRVRNRSLFWSNFSLIFLYSCPLLTSPIKSGSVGRSVGFVPWFSKKNLIWF